MRKPSRMPLRSLLLALVLAGMLVGCAWSHHEGSRPVTAREIPRELVVTGRFRGLYA